MPSSSNELHLKRRKLDENFDQKTSKVSTTVLKSVLGQLDSITASSSDSLNQLFLKFLVENGIDFKTANSKYLQEFVEKIRPAKSSSRIRFCQPFMSLQSLQSRKANHNNVR